MLEHQVHELVAVDQPEVLTGPAEVYRILGKRPEGDEQAQLRSSGGQRTGELLDLGSTNGTDRPLALNLDAPDEIELATFGLKG